MTEQHTPGPWRIVPSHRRGFTVDRVDGGARIAALHVGAKATAQIESNARLIAAAPELLAALTELLRVDEEDWDGTLAPEMREARNKAKAAIAKAEGAGPAGGKDDDDAR